MRLLSTIELLKSVIRLISCVLISLLHQAIEQRKVEFPNRPLIRVSSTLFWHLSPDYDLVPIAALKDQAGKLRAKNLEAGWDEGDEVIYEPIKVREQVRKHDECSKQPTPT